MAKNQGEGNPVAQIEQLKKQLADMNLPEEVKEKMISNAYDAVSEGARKALVSDIEKLVKHDKHIESRKLLSGQRLSVSVTFNEGGEGTIENITDRLTRPRRMKSNGRAKGNTANRKFLVNGEEFDTAADAARNFGIDFKGDSAVRALKRAKEAGQIDSYEEIDATEAEPETAEAEA